MALYEGIALIQEKQAVVLDLGTDYTKFGFTGEAAPRCIVRSEFWCPAERRYKRLHDYSSPQELYDNISTNPHLASVVDYGLITLNLGKAPSPSVGTYSELMMMIMEGCQQTPVN
ncbi:Actin-related protein 10 [Papilio xuthus]|uniref:Actin-related protein 10 n=1 Tax=Papilio xuthus TaxID=66420 RepID=A0A0N1IQL3_PAPXU|nr:Actin-related protein 10 [Papilio xuthus]